MVGWKDFKKYALSHGVHNGPVTIRALEKVYNQHKGSRYSTIVALFKMGGRLHSEKEYHKEMGHK